MNEIMEVGMDFREFGRILLKRLWIIVLCAAILGASVLVYTLNFVAPMYTTSVSIYVNNSTSENSSGVSSGDLAVALRLVATYVNIIQSDTVLEKVVEETGLMISTNQLRGMISAGAIGETEMFSVKVTTPNPQMSADLANAIAVVAPPEIAKIIEGSSAKVIDYAKVPTRPSSPNYAKNTILGVIAGGVLAVMFFFMQTLLDLRIKSEADLTRISNIPVLGVIPDLASETKQKKQIVRR